MAKIADNIAEQWTNCTCETRGGGNVYLIELSYHVYGNTRSRSAEYHPASNRASQLVIVTNSVLSEHTSLSRVK